MVLNGNGTTVQVTSELRALSVRVLPMKQVSLPEIVAIFSLQEMGGEAGEY